jgi:hypothetical protein
MKDPLTGTGTVSEQDSDTIARSGGQAGIFVAGDETAAWDDLRARRPGPHGRSQARRKRVSAGGRVGLLLIVDSERLGRLYWDASFTGLGKRGRVARDTCPIIRASVVAVFAKTRLADVTELRPPAPAPPGSSAPRR